MTYLGDITLSGVEDAAPLTVVFEIVIGLGDETTL